MECRVVALAGEASSPIRQAIVAELGARDGAFGVSGAPAAFSAAGLRRGKWRPLPGGHCPA